MSGHGFKRNAIWHRLSSVLDNLGMKKTSPHCQTILNLPDDQLEICMFFIGDLHTVCLVNQTCSRMHGIIQAYFPELWQQFVAQRKIPSFVFDKVRNNLITEGHQWRQTPQAQNPLRELLHDIQYCERDWHLKKMTERDLYGNATPARRATACASEMTYAMILHVRALQNDTAEFNPYPLMDVNIEFKENEPIWPATIAKLYCSGNTCTGFVYRICIHDGTRYCKRVSPTTVFKSKYQWLHLCVDICNFEAFKPLADYQNLAYFSADIVDWPNVKHEQLNDE